MRCSVLADSGRGRNVRHCLHLGNVWLDLAPAIAIARLGNAATAGLPRLGGAHQVAGVEGQSAHLGLRLLDCKEKVSDF